MSKLEGIIPAVVTPLTPDGRFNSYAFEQLLERLYSAGVHGMYVCGQTGEGLLQSVEQRKKVAEAASRNSPRGKQVIVHTGTHRTEDALELTRHASRIGVSAVSSLPPIGVYSFREVRAYYEALAAASEVPFLVYYFPELSPAITTIEQILELADIPNVAGLKFTDFDLYRLSILKENGAVVFNGRDEVLAAGLLMGADGGIGSFYNLIPELFVRVYELAGAGMWADVRPVQSRINELIRLTLRFPQMAALKKMLEWSGIECGACIEPRGSLSEEDERGLQNAIASSSFAGEKFARTAARR